MTDHNYYLLQYVFTIKPGYKRTSNRKTRIRFQNWRRSLNWAAFFSPVGVEKNTFVLWWLVIRDQSGLYDVLKPLCLCIESIWYLMQKNCIKLAAHQDLFAKLHILICSQKIIMDSWDFIYFFTKTISVKVSVRKLSQSFCSKILKIKVPARKFSKSKFLLEKYIMNSEIEVLYEFWA